MQFFVPILIKKYLFSANGVRMPKNNVETCLQATYENV